MNNNTEITATVSRTVSPMTRLERMKAMVETLRAKQADTLMVMGMEKAELRKEIHAAETLIRGKRVIRSASFLANLRDRADTLLTEAVAVESRDENQ